MHDLSDSALGVTKYLNFPSAMFSLEDAAEGPLPSDATSDKNTKALSRAKFAKIAKVEPQALASSRENRFVV